MKATHPLFATKELAEQFAKQQAKLGRTVSRPYEDHDEEGWRVTILHWE